MPPFMVPRSCKMNANRGEQIAFKGIQKLQEFLYPPERFMVVL